MKRILYSSLSVLTAIGTVFVAAKAEVFSSNSNTPKATETFTPLDSLLGSTSDDSLFSSSAQQESGLSAFGISEASSLANGPRLENGLSAKSQSTIRSGKRAAIASANGLTAAGESTALNQPALITPVTTASTGTAQSLPISAVSSLSSVSEPAPSFSSTKAVQPSLSNRLPTQVAQATEPVTEQITEEEPAAVPVDKPSAASSQQEIVPAGTLAAPVTIPGAADTSLPTPTATPTPTVVPSTSTPAMSVPTPGVGLDATPESGIVPAAPTGTPVQSAPGFGVADDTEDVFEAMPAEAPAGAEMFEAETFEAETPETETFEATPVEAPADVETFGEEMPEGPVEEEAFGEDSAEDAFEEEAMEEEGAVENAPFESAPAEDSLENVPTDGSIEMEIEEAPLEQEAIEQEPLEQAPLEQAPLNEPIPATPSAPITPETPAPGAPVEAIPPASVEEVPMEAPVQAPIEAPIEAPIQAPIEAPEEPVQQLPPVNAPFDSDVPEPEAFPTPEPLGSEGSSSDRLIGEGFTPFQLSYLAISGGLQEEGIPGGGQLVNAYEDGNISAEDIVAAGAMTKRLGTAASDESDYTKSVDTVLKLFVRDDRTN
ncbi:MAG: hypothetical protein AAFY72_03565 [Cyanobacteria bacterium J06649_4]